MMYYIAMAAEQARADSGRWVTGQVLAGSRGGFEFNGFNQRLRAGRNGEGMQARYVVLDYSGIGSTLYSTHVLEAAHTDGRTGGLKYLGRSIHFAGSTPYTDSSCWFSPYFACTGGECYWVKREVITFKHRQCTFKLFFSFFSGLDSATVFFLFLLILVLAGCAGNIFLNYKY